MITVKIWREMNNFDPLANGKFDIDNTIKYISIVRGKTADEVEQMPADELLPEFLKCLREINNSVFAKLDQMPKNG